MRVPPVDVLQITAISAATCLFLLTAVGAARRTRMESETIRKLVHIVFGVVIFLAPLVIRRWVVVAAVAAIFTVINMAATAYGWLREVHGTDRRSHGTIYFPLSLLLLSPLWERYPDVVAGSMLVLAIGDAAAGLVGRFLRYPRLFTVTGDVKSVEGTIAMFLGSMAALASTVAVYGHLGLGLSSVLDRTPVVAGLGLVAVSLFVTGWEAGSSRGLDNLTIPLATALGLWLCAFPAFSITPTDAPSEAALRFILGCALGTAVAMVSVRFRLLSFSGAVATFLLAVLVFGSGGWAWTVPILTFFVLSSALSRIGRQRKRQFEQVFEKGAIRDAGQVAANGATVGVLAVVARLSGEAWLYWPALGAVAAVTADTWATEIGTLTRVHPRSILGWRRVAPGTSGAVSLPGTAGGALGAALIGVVGIAAAGAGSTLHVSIVVLAGLAGSAVDSLLGATAQVQYRCVECGMATEQTRHCAQDARLARGWPWINNDVVNLGCALTGALAVALMLG